MSVDQLPVRLREFVNYLDGLLARLDQGGGWCGVFWRRDPEGMQACLDGREMPPWDVVEALLHDLADEYGPGGAEPERERARALHAAALAVYDARPGSRDLLGDRLDVMLREQRYAAERQMELGRLLGCATGREEADALRVDLAWARDDHERATARCAELRARMADLDRRAASAQGQAIRRARVGEGFRRAGSGSDRFGSDRFGGARFAGDRGGADGTRSSGARSPGGGGFPVMPRRRDAWPAADAAGWSEERARGHAWADEDRHEGRGADVPPAEAAEWRSHTEHAEGLGWEWDQGPFADPCPRRGATGPSARPDTRGPETAGTDWPGTRRTPAATGPGDPAPYSSGTPALDPAPDPDPAPKQRKRRRGSARFAGMAEDDAVPVVLPTAVVPTLPAQPVIGRGTPRGARFAGAGAEAPVQAAAEARPIDAADRREVVETVDALVRLRREGRSGEAHVRLVEAASWPPVRFPLLAAEMQRAGLAADWATLLWEAASLPAERLVAAADALAAAGRAHDGQRILRQGVVRPASEIGHAVVALADEGRRREVRALLGAYVRVRTPEEAARSAEPDPDTLVPLLVEAARGVSDECRWDLVHALRVAGFTA